MVVQGEPHSLRVTLEEISTNQAGGRGSAQAALTDLPFMSYQLNPQQLSRVRADSSRKAAHASSSKAANEVPPPSPRSFALTFGHAALGMTPAIGASMGGSVSSAIPSVSSTTLSPSEQAGRFAIVVECVPADLAEQIRTSVNIPTMALAPAPARRHKSSSTHDMLGC